jgi:hypothetical protein
MNIITTIMLLVSPIFDSIRPLKKKLNTNEKQVISLIIGCIFTYFEKYGMKSGEFLCLFMAAPNPNTIIGT